MLHKAAEKGRVNKINILLDHARNKDKMTDIELKNWINAKSSNTGSTPLHVSVQVGEIKVINVLLSNGADRKALNDEG